MAESLLEVLADIYVQAGGLDPAAFLGRASELTRGGLPGQSFSDGRGGGISAGGFDKADQVIRRKRNEFDKGLRHIQVEFRRLVQIQSWMLQTIEATPDPECETAGCTNRVPDGRKSCSRCRTYLSRYGVEWTPPKTEVNA